MDVQRSNIYANVMRVTSLDAHASKWVTSLDTHFQTLQIDTGNCISNSSFSEESEENVTLLLEQDTLNETDELVLINATVNWARREALRRGLPNNDEGVRTVLEPRLLSLFRFRALSHQQFQFGPGLADWLTTEEKDAVDFCLHSKKYQSYPQHFSLALLRNQVKCHNEHLMRKYSHQIYYCNRVALGSDAEILRQENTKCCFDSRAKCCPCLHVRGFFRVKTKCYLLGIQIASKTRSTDSTILTNQNHKYKEDIDIEVFNCSYSLAKDLKQTKVCSFKYKKETTYNNTLTLMFHKKIALSTDNWFAIFIKLRSKGTFGYCKLKRAARVCSAGVEFFFQTKKHVNCHAPLNESLIQSLIFSVS